MTKFLQENNLLNTDPEGTYLQTKLTFSVISKQKAGNELMYIILYFKIYL